MNFFSVSVVLAACRVGLVMLWLAVIPSGFAADTAGPASLESYDYAEPGRFTGTLYEIGSGRKKVL